MSTEIRVDLEFEAGNMMRVVTPTNLGLYPLLNARQIEDALDRAVKWGMRTHPEDDPSASWHYVTYSKLAIVHPEIRHVAIINSGLTANSPVWPLNQDGELMKYLRIKRVHHLQFRADGGPWRDSR